MLTNSSLVYRFGTNCLFRVSFARYSTSRFPTRARRHQSDPALIFQILRSCHRALTAREIAKILHLHPVTVTAVRF
jgi:hypothetical protein